MKRIFNFGIVVALAGVMFFALTGCASRPNLDAQRELAIRQSFAEKYSVNIVGVSVAFYYGTYNGTSVVLMTSTEFGAATVITTEIIAGISFTFPSSNVFVAWRDGNFYSVQDAYDNGFLTRSHLRTIRNIKRG